MMDFMNASDRSMQSARGTGLFITLGWVFAILSLFIYPFIFGTVGVITGILAAKKGSKAALAVIIANIVLMGIGLVFSGTILNYTRHYLGI